MLLMKRDVQSEAIVRAKFQALKPALNERSRRIWVATEARALGYGGIATVSRATGLCDKTIRAGLAELKSGVEETKRVRKPGAGRPRNVDKQPALAAALLTLIDPIVRGDPESPLLWTTKSAAKLATELQGQGFHVSSSSVWRMLRDMGFRLQSTKKTLERKHHPDRDGQFTFINGAVKDFHARGAPTISVDTKKKELVGDFANGGREWHRKGQPPEVLGHDFPSDAIGKAVPYGVYDIQRNEAMVNVGVDHDTAAFAVESIRRWWIHMGSECYPDAKELLVTADAGGSNGYRSRSWKVELQKLANETGLAIYVVHFPPGTSKWNKIEHRLFGQLSKNWRGRPLSDYVTVIELIAATTTQTGLQVRSLLDTASYPTGQGVTKAELSSINLEKSVWHGEWNYVLLPTGQSGGLF